MDEEYQQKQNLQQSISPSSLLQSRILQMPRNVHWHSLYVQFFPAFESLCSLSTRALLYCSGKYVRYRSLVSSIFIIIYHGPWVASNSKSPNVRTFTYLYFYLKTDAIYYTDISDTMLKYSKKFPFYFYFIGFSLSVCFCNSSTRCDHAIFTLGHHCSVSLP